jgi:acyl transferase domain-containing protein
MRAVFEGARGLPLGSLKSNVGHLITASGGAAIIKVLAAMRDKIRPPTRNADAPIDELADGMFRLLGDEERWESSGPRRAAISNFGFGGNNAHLILEEWSPSVTASDGARIRRDRAEPIAVIAQAIRTGAARDSAAITTAIFSTSAATVAPEATRAHTVEIDAAGLRFPPTDLRAALPQQLLLLEAAQELATALDRLPHERTSVLIGMQCDAEVARHAVRWCGDREWVAALPEALRNEPLSAASVVGCMPNIVANRLSHQLDCRGPCLRRQGPRR